MIELNWNTNRTPMTAATQYPAAEQFPAGAQYPAAAQYSAQQYPAAAQYPEQQRPAVSQRVPPPESYQEMLNGAAGIDEKLGEIPPENVGYTQANIEMLENPMSVSEAYQTSWKSLLAQNLGRYVLVSFLMGTQQTVVAEGVLYEVGNDYIVLYQPVRDSYITADLYSVKFVEFRAADNQTRYRYDVSRRNG